MTLTPRLRRRLIAAAVAIAAYLVATGALDLGRPGPAWTGVSAYATSPEGLAAWATRAQPPFCRPPAADQARAQPPRPRRCDRSRPASCRDRGPRSSRRAQVAGPGARRDFCAMPE